MKQLKFNLDNLFRLSTISAVQTFELENNSTELIISTDVKPELAYELHIESPEGKSFVILEKADGAVKCLLNSGMLKLGVNKLQLRGVGANDYSIESNRVEFTVKSFINASVEPEPSEQTAFEKLVVEVNVLKNDVDSLSDKIDSAESAVAALGTDLELEKVNRANSDSLLDSKIEAEREAREMEDSSIKNSIQNIEEAKQDKLVAGENITIEGNVISAPGGGGTGDVTKQYLEDNYYDKDFINQLNDNAEHKTNKVSEITDENKDSEENYPSNKAMTEYMDAQRTYREVVLYDNPSGIEFYPQSPKTITLPQSIKDFDAICFTASFSDATDYRNTTVIPVSSIVVDGVTMTNTYCIGNRYESPSVKFTADNTVVLQGYSSSEHMMMYRIVGIKYASSVKYEAPVNDVQINGNSIVFDGVANITGLASQEEVTTIKADLNELDNELSTIIKSAISFVEDARPHTTNYYKIVSGLDTSKVYALRVKTQTSGSYELKAGTNAGASYMVDTIGTFDFEADVDKLICFYKPSGDYTHFRISSDIVWELSLYTLADISNFESSIISNTSRIENNEIDISLIADIEKENNNLFDKNASGIEYGGIRLSQNNNWYANEAYAETDYMPCIGGGTTYYIHSNTTLHCCWYNSEKTFITGATTTRVSDTVQKVVVTSSSARFLRVGFLLNTINDFYVSLTETPTIKEIALVKNGQQWKGKKWYAFGTSITDTSYINEETGEVTGKYVPYLAEMSGMTVVNCGIAGGTWCNNILAKVLSTDISDADLITIEGCVNDFASGSDIGTYGDYLGTTIAGAMLQMAKYCNEHSNATVIFLTETTGKQYTLKSGVSADYRFSYTKASGKRQIDYNNAIKQFAEYMQIPCIDAGAKSQINYFNPQFIIDQIHHTELGGKQYAQTIWNELKMMMPKKTE